MSDQINLSDFDLAATLHCGQAFRWSRDGDGGHLGVVGRSVWRLQQTGPVLRWQIEGQPPRPERLAAVRDYLSLDRPLRRITASFPDDLALRQAVKIHWGLRVLRQEPWECLASFIASSSKQIVQIRQIVAALSRRFGEPLDTVLGVHHAFPPVGAIARASHAELIECKLGFRAKYLLEAARMVDRGEVDLERLPRLELERAREELLKLPGVGEKIANCVLLFSCGHDEAFPIDVWIGRALRRIYFPGRERVPPRQLHEFTRQHFGPHAGWAQQYLFFQERRRPRPAGA